jgi:hypothetical protein
VFKKFIGLVFLLFLGIIILLSGCKGLFPPSTPKTYTITTTAGENGSIEPSGEITIKEGDSQTFTINPDEGYEIEDVLVDDVSKGVIASYTFTNVQQDHTISATFREDNTNDEMSETQDDLTEGVDYKVVVSKKIDLEVGGVVEVTDESSEIYGTRLVIDPIIKERQIQERGLEEITIVLSEQVFGINRMIDYQGFLITPVGVTAAEDIFGSIRGSLEIEYSKDKLSNSGVSEYTIPNVYRLFWGCPWCSWEKVPEEKVIHEENRVKIDVRDVGDLKYLYTLTVTNCIPPFDLGTPLPGDLIYRLSLRGVNDNWVPGHVGIYIGDRYGDHDNDSTTSDIVYNVIEALSDGVQGTYYSDITNFGAGPPTYMGAREPKNQSLNHLTRNIMIDWLKSMIGMPYATIETFGVYFGWARGDQVKGDNGSYNCVGLAEKAYEIAGVNNFEGLVSDYDEGNLLGVLKQDRILSPQEQLFRTDPASGIIDQNTAPVISSIEIVHENPEIGDLVKVNCHATDQDGDDLAYKWTIEDESENIIRGPFIEDEQIDLQIPSNHFFIKCKAIDNYGGEGKFTEAVNLGDDEVVQFEDPNLEQVVRETINKPEGTLYLSDVIEIKDLEAIERGIESLEGIQQLQNLKSLGLWINQISDISPLQTLTNLWYLSLHGNQISDITPIKTLTNLSYLNFCDNQVSDITTVQSLTNLEILFFTKNQVSDLSPLQNLTNLWNLSFGDNPVTEISVLENLTKLKHLGLFLNQISDITPIQNLTALEFLNFDATAVTDISVLENLVNLDILSFSCNQVQDISALVNNEGLGPGDEIDMRWNHLDLEPGSQNMQDIDTLISRGVYVEYEPQEILTVPNIIDFTVNPSTITEGDSSILSWSVTDADNVTISPDIGSVGWSDAITINPSYTTTYTLVATNSAGSTTATATVTVIPSSDISASITSYSPSTKITVNTGQSFTISTTFDNTGNTAAYFYAGASVWDSGGSVVFDDWSGKMYLNPGDQKTASWTHTINIPGEYWLQFGVWDETKSQLLDKKPSPSQNLIRIES